MVNNFHPGLALLLDTVRQLLQVVATGRQQQCNHTAGLSGSVSCFLVFDKGLVYVLEYLNPCHTTFAGPPNSTALRCCDEHYPFANIEVRFWCQSNWLLCVEWGRPPSCLLLSAAKYIGLALLKRQQCHVLCIYTFICILVPVRLLELQTG